MEGRARILCVDDEEGIVRLVTSAFRSKYHVSTASSGEEALGQLAAHPDTAVILSDMWMPGMDGVTLLKRAHELSPDIVRVLFTGQPDLRTAVAAVNLGHIFRFLTKPVPMAELIATVDAAVQQHRLVTAERVLLEETLHGSVHALTDALSMASPIAFGRATRVKELVAALSASLALRASWQVEVAAMLSQLATITLPAETLARLCYGNELSHDDERMIARLPEVTETLLGHIPRLEAVREILRAATAKVPRKVGAGPLDGNDPDTWAHLLRAALDYDLLLLQGSEPGTAVATLRSRRGVYDRRIIDALAKVSGDLMTSQELRELPLSGVRAGMILVDNVVLASGMLLVCSGASVTVSLLERLRNLPRGSVREPIRVNVSPAKEMAESPEPSAS